jgi:ssRNA-specific RNase YbeY (16S rRNA maturation enzyme)
MFKISLFITLLALSTTQVFCQDSAYPNFEAELRAIETNQLKTEDLQMRNADAVTDVISDEVATGQAGILRKTVNTLDVDNSDTDVIVPQKEMIKSKERRIRSR